MKKRPILILLCTVLSALLIAALFAGCASTEGGKDVNKTNEPGGATDQASDATEGPTAAPTSDPAKVFTDTLAKVEPNPDQHVTMTVTDEGYDVFAPLDGKWGYRYGPSIIYYPDGSIDAWFATPGTSGEWDWFTYKHSDDNGATWSKEVVVLRPTPDSMDHYSVCDPGVVYFDGYYYLGYTSTIVSTNGGINNNVFVARSQNPDGPFEKWNGEGWGGDPQPIVYFDEADGQWGAGEVSFVHVDGTLYIYYQWVCGEGRFTRVATAPATFDWPAHMTYQGFCYTAASTQDSCDVVYIEDIGKFVAFSTYDRFSATSGIALFESDDGINFTKADIIRTGIAQFCHNMGISKRPDGHIQLGDNIFVGYAYYDGRGDNWGKWPTRFQHVSLSVYEGKITTSDKNGKGMLLSDYFWEAPEQFWPIAIGSLPQLAQTHIGEGTYTIPMYWYDTNLGKHEITDVSKVTFDGYDENIISISGNVATLKAIGDTEVTMHYEGLSQTFKLRVRDNDFKYNMTEPDIVSFTPVNDNITVYMKDGGKTHKVQIRGFVVFEDETWGEAYNDKTKSHKDYPAMVDAGVDKYNMTFEVADDSICTVSKTGIIKAKAPGTTTVKVTMGGNENLTFTVTVTVEENRD